jgi:hypothetical protein
MPQAKVNLGLSNQDFITGLNEAERRAQGFEQRIAGFFKRDPTARAQHAFTDLATNLSSGNVAQGVAGFTSRLSGLGLAAGVAVGAAIAIFQRFTTEIRETDKAAEALGAQLDKPRTITGSLGLEGMRAELQKTIQLTDQLAAKSTSVFSRVAQGARQGGLLGAIGAFATAGRQDIGAGELGAGLGAQVQIRKDIAAGEAEIARIKETSLSVSEEEAALQDISRQAAEKKAAILNETLDAQNKITLQLKEDAARRAVGQAGLHPSEIKALEDASARLGAADTQRLGAIDRIAAAERAAAQQKFETQARAIAAAQEEANMELRGASATELKLSKLKNALSLIQAQLDPSRKLTEEARAQLQLEETKAQTALRSAQKEEFFKPAGQRQEEAIAAAFRREQSKQFERATGIVKPKVVTEEAKAEITELQRQIESLKAPARPIVPAVLTDDAKAKVADLQIEIDRLGAIVKPQLSTEDAKAKIQQLQDQIDHIRPEGMSVDLLTDEAKAKIADLQKQIAGLDAAAKLKPEVSVEEAKSKIADLRARIEILNAGPGKTITPQVLTDAAKAKIEELQKRINELTGKTVKVGVETGDTGGIGYPGKAPRFDISGNLIRPTGNRLYEPYGPPPGRAGPTHPEAYGVLGEPSPKTGHVYESQLGALSRHMEPLAPGLTTGTGPSETWRSMFPPPNVLGPQPPKSPEQPAEDKEGADIVGEIKELTNQIMSVWR